MKPLSLVCIGLHCVVMRWRVLKKQQADLESGQQLHGRVWNYNENKSVIQELVMACGCVCVLRKTSAVTTDSVRGQLCADNRVVRAHVKEGNNECAQPLSTVLSLQR